MDTIGPDRFGAGPQASGSGPWFWAGACRSLSRLADGDAVETSVPRADGWVFVLVRRAARRCVEGGGGGLVEETKRRLRNTAMPGARTGLVEMSMGHGCERHRNRDEISVQYLGRALCG